MLLSFLLSLCFAHPHQEVDSLSHPTIYVANPVYGQASNRSTILDSLLLSVTPRHANSTFLKGYKDIHVYAGVNIKSFTECDYASDPLYCGVENGNWTLTTFIDETPKLAVIVLTLYDSRGLILATTSQSKASTEKCDITQKETSIRGNGPKGAYSQKLEEKQTGQCYDVAPLIDFHMINQAVMSLFLAVK